MNYIKTGRWIKRIDVELIAIALFIGVILGSAI